MTTVALVAHWDWVLYNYRLPFVRALRERGVRVCLVCPPGAYSDALVKESDRWIPWEIDRPGINPITEARSVSSLVRIYRDERPDLVQHYGLKPNLYGSLAARRTGVERSVNTYTGLGYLFSQDSRARRLRSLVLPLLRAVMRRSDAWSVVLTPDDLATLTRQRVVEPARTTILPEGVDVSAFTPRNGTKSGAPTVFMAGRLLWDKGLAELVAAAGLLRSRDVEARFVVAGEPDEGNPASVESSQVAAWNEAGHVEFLGHRSDVPELLRGADVAVLPSYHEGLPRFLLEAAATGLAIVASDIPGCRAVVEDGRSALLVPPRDAAALAAALERVVTDESLRVRLGREARARVVERFSENNVVDQHLELFRRLGLSLA